MSCVVAFQILQGWRMMMSKKRYQLHWITAVLAVLKALKDMVIPIVLLFFVNGVNDTGKWYLDYLTFLIFGLLAIIFLVTGIIHWRRYVYWFEDGELRIEYGLFVKKKRYIPFERIQSLSYTEGILHRPFNLIKVSVETAGGSSSLEADVELTAITKDAAAMIEQEIAEAKNRKVEPVETDEGLPIFAEVEEEPPAKNIFKMSGKDLVILATTSGGIGIILSGALIFMGQFSELLPLDRIFEEVSVFIKSGIYLVMLVSLFVLLVVWGISVGRTFLSYYGFTVQIVDEDIVITRGLLEKKKVTVPLNRVQSVRIVENPLRQLFGYATVIIDSAGGGVEGEGARINLLPLAKRKVIEEPLSQLFPELILEKPSKKLPARSKQFYYLFNFYWSIPVMAIISYYAYPFGLFVFLLLPLIWLLGLWRHRSGAFHISGQQLTLRYRRISLQTVYVMKKRIQSMQMKQNYFHRKKHVATISASIKSGGMAFEAQVKHMEEVDAERILAWYEPKFNARTVEEQVPHK